MKKYNELLKAYEQTAAKSLFPQWEEGHIYSRQYPFPDRDAIVFKDRHTTSFNRVVSDFTYLCCCLPCWWGKRSKIVVLGVCWGYTNVGTGGASISGIERQVLRQARLLYEKLVGKVGADGNYSQSESKPHFSLQTAQLPGWWNGMERKIHDKSFFALWSWSHLYMGLCFPLNRNKHPLWKSADCKSWLTAVQIATRRG